MQVKPIDYRARLVRAAAELKGGALLALSQPTAYRNSTVGHAYRQESFLHYLTGFEEPEAALLVLPWMPEKERFHVFLRDRDPVHELWEGRRLGVERAATDLAIDRAHSIGTLWEKLPELLADANALYTTIGLNEDYDRRIIQTLTTHKAKHGKKAFSAKLPLCDALLIAGKLRLRKQPEEVERMKAAAAITKRAYQRVYASVRPGMNEREVHGMLLGEFLAGGADMEAYGSIVAGGVNACILHYHENNCVLKDGDLLLIDAGSQFQYYASDVTRTFPVGKSFTPEQKALYEIVLASQRAAIAKAVPGSTLTAMYDASVDVLVDGMLHIGLMKGARAEIIQTKSFKKYFPHGLSHWIGMDVHDVGVYNDGGEPIPLEPGMYFSVEPGIYVDPADDTAPKGLRGVGIRIEDDVLVTASGPDVITGGIAKTVAELEGRS